MVQPQLPSCLRPRSVHQKVGVAHDHELHPKQPTDQDSVEAVARQRDCITQAAADSEIVLPLAASSDQASTAAPADDEPAMFGREEEWFDTITRDNIKDLRGTTYVQPPTIQVCSPTGSARRPPCHHAPRPLLLRLRACLESSRAQQLAPPLTTHHQCF